ncbi:MAG: MerR family transcriptional regulator [Sandaracinus sp.]
MRPVLPDKLFFRIGEVAELVGVRPHVLRYWEEEFGILKPMKTRGAHRQFRRRDVELAIVIKRLLQDEGFTIAGARRKLRELGHVEVEAGAARPEDARTTHRAELVALRSELAGLLARLDGLGARRAPVVVLDERSLGPARPAAATALGASVLPLSLGRERRIEE